MTKWVVRQILKIIEEGEELEAIIKLSKENQRFKYEVAEEPGGENIKACFACGVCTGSCPISDIDEEYNPRKIIRMILLGMKKEVLSSNLIWMCALCHKCSFYCPQDVKFADVMSALRNIAVREGYVHPSFTETIEKIDKYTQEVRLKMIKAILDKKTKKLSVEAEKLISEIVKPVTKKVRAKGRGKK
ncbi:MAG: heterodisulfide reductase [Armatimonadetes bacterium CG07_land_8_20_14_0_80_40_9]|nr:MAG: heterodisulfide reductase [Armatimonadetes bacterium CG07_land_8_20_14_0_80_40_9]